MTLTAGAPGAAAWAAVCQVDGPEAIPAEQSIFWDAARWLLVLLTQDAQSPEAYRGFRELPNFAAELLAGILELAWEQREVDDLSAAEVIALANLLSVAGRAEEATTLLTGVVASRGQALALDNARYSVACRAAGKSDDLSDRFCPSPYERCDVLPGGNLHQCCAAFLPIAAGNVFSQGWEEVWNGDPARAVRRTMHDGSFRFCNKMICPEIQGGLPRKSEIAADPERAAMLGRTDGSADGRLRYVGLAFDRTCNLRCPSCRTRLIAMSREERAAVMPLVRENLYPLLERTRIASVTGAGDPFASPIFRELLQDLTFERFPGIKLKLMTNGVLFTPEAWARIAHLAGRIGEVAVSVDAACAETYASVRAGGDWRRLQENLRFIASLRREGAIDAFNLAFVVQEENWREMAAFIELAESLGVDRVHFSCVQNWGTWSREDFAGRAVHLSSHPAHREFCASLADPVFDHKVSDLGDVAQYRVANGG